MLSDEQILIRERNELARLKKEKDKGLYTGYIFIMMFLIVLVNMLDETASTIGTTVITNIVESFFVYGTFFGRSFTLTEGISIHNAFSVFTGAASILAPLYKVLGDRIGRKPLFIISTLGMGVGMLLIYVSKNYFMYLAGAVIVTFFTSHDMQILYVLEEAPKDKRTTIYSAAKGISIIGTLCIPYLRDLLMGNDGTKWHQLFGIPGLCGVIFAVLAVIFLKETRPFIDKRIKYLEIPLEERRVQKKKELENSKIKATEKLGILKAIKVIFTHKELRVLMIAQVTFCSALLAMSKYYQPIMNDAGMSTEEITTALIPYSIIFGIITIFSGMISDKLGRKKTVVGFASIALICYIMFILASYLRFPPIVVGIFYALYIGSYWIGKDYIEIMMTENTPTQLRASVMAGANFIYLLGTGLGFCILTLGVLFLPIWIPCVVLVVPALTISIFLIITKAKETKGVDYEDLDNNGEIHEA